MNILQDLRNSFGTFGDLDQAPPPPPAEPSRRRDDEDARKIFRRIEHLIKMQDRGLKTFPISISRDIYKGLNVSYSLIVTICRDLIRNPALRERFDVRELE